jgi:hypothetical protein
MLFFKYKDKGILEFPGEKEIEESSIEEEKTSVPTFKEVSPIELIKKLPKDIRILCNEFNFNYKNKKENSCILILRRILPLSIVRKFQKIDEENEIKKDGDYLNTKKLMGKVEKILKTKRVYQDVMNYKLILDSSQHSYTLNVTMTDTQGAGLAVRVFLEDLFSEYSPIPS